MGKRPKSSRYYGVSRVRNKWAVAINLKGQYWWGGQYGDEPYAARVADAGLIAMGLAPRNFPRSEQRTKRLKIKPVPHMAPAVNKSAKTFVVPPESQEAVEASVKKELLAEFHLCRGCGFDTRESCPKCGGTFEKVTLYKEEIAS